MTQDVYLTGITTTGTPHIGNYVGAIRPGIEASKDLETRHFYFLADYHSLAKNEDPDKIALSTLEIAAAWMAVMAPELERGGVFAAFGALHLPGAEGVVELLRQKGFTVTRVEG